MRGDQSVIYKLTNRCDFIVIAGQAGHTNREVLILDYFEGIPYLINIILTAAVKVFVDSLQK